METIHEEARAITLDNGHKIPAVLTIHIDDEDIPPEDVFEFPADIEAVRSGRILYVSVCWRVVAMGRQAESWLGAVTAKNLDDLKAYLTECYTNDYWEEIRDEWIRDAESDYLKLRPLFEKESANAQE